MTNIMTNLVQNITQINRKVENPDPLGNSTSYSASRTDKGIQLTEKQLSKLKYDFKKLKVERKKAISKKVPRVGYCGTRLISKNTPFIEAVKGETGGIYYKAMQRCGSVHLCPDCMYKLMKERAEELYSQLKAYKDQSKSVLFVTFTLQHKYGDSLELLHKTLLDAFNFANSHGAWKKAKKDLPVEYLRALEVLHGVNGWHPHLHCVFVGDLEIAETINIFINLYKKYLVKCGLLVNEHTVVTEKWNGKLDSMTDYLFKGMLEQELTGGGLKKSGKGKTFFELIDEGNDQATDEYIRVMKGKRQYHHSRGFFNDVRVKTDEEIIKEETASETLFIMSRKQYSEIHYKGIAMHLLNEYEYGGVTRAIKLLELYDCDTVFLSG